MDVLLVTAVVSGGVGRHVHHLAQGLVERGHRVAVVCPAAVAERFAFAEVGARVLPMQIGVGRRLWLAPAELARLGRLMAGVDVVHAHGVRAGAVTGLARRGRRSALVVTSHNAPPEGPAGLAYRALEQVAYRRADVVLAVSPDLVQRAMAARRQAPRGTEVALAVVPADDVVPTDDVAPTDEQGRRTARLTLRAELGLPAHGGPAVILSAGRLARQKRMAVLVAAYHLLVRGDGGGDAAGDQPVLVIAGDGPAGTALAEQVAAGPGDVRLLGHRDDVPTLLAGADLAVSAARWEGQPLFLQEALAAGVPVVATDVGGSGVVLGGAGLLVPGDDGQVVAGLLRGMQKVLADPALAAELGERSSRRAAELPTVDDAVQAALAVYRRALRPQR